MIINIIHIVIPLGFMRRCGTGGTFRRNVSRRWIFFVGKYGGGRKAGKYSMCRDGVRTGTAGLACRRSLSTDGMQKPSAGMLRNGKKKLFLGEPSGK